MSSRFPMLARAAAMAAMLAVAPPAVAQQTYDVDPEMRIQQLENQLRQLTGQNEELQYRNRQLEDRLRQLGAAPAPASRPSLNPTSRLFRRNPAQCPGNHRSSRRPTTSRLRPRRRSSRNRQRRNRKAAAAAMPSIPIRIPMRRARRARSAADNCRSRAKRRSALPADAGRASRSISATRPASARWRRRSAAAARSGRHRGTDHAAAIGNAAR